MIHMRVYRCRHDLQEREKVLEEIFADRSLHVRSKNGDEQPARECTELLVDVEGGVERVMVRLIERLAQAVRQQRIADFGLSLADGTIIACPKGRVIQVSWPAFRSGELATYLAEQLGGGSVRPQE
jgi:hypothetical protein